MLSRIETSSQAAGINKEILGTLNTKRSERYSAVGPGCTVHIPPTSVSYLHCYLSKADKFGSIPPLSADLPNSNKGNLLYRSFNACHSLVILSQRFS